MGGGAPSLLPETTVGASGKADQSRPFSTLGLELALRRFGKCHRVAI
jgi:hypothetical protein